MNTMLKLVYCVECGLVLMGEEVQAKNQVCAYCNKETAFKKLDKKAVAIADEDETNAKLKSVYKLFTEGKAEGVDFLFK
ncbi:MAG: hypothetical protein INQ03_17600 [Candidatus Heimdallarchaeota archaeon]|nr:hypothetical protein [Candidatus Heimdallarchaeota archaeon]